MFINQKALKKVLSTMITLSILISTTPIFANETVGEESFKSFYVVHNNDTHARTNGDPITAGLKDMLEENGDNYAILHGGDAFQGQAIASITKGEAIASIMNEVGYHYLVPGNHEFDFGFDRLLEFEEMSNYKFLSANIFYKDTNELVFQDSDILEYPNGLKVGYFGLTTTETATKTTPAYVENIIFGDYIDAAEKMVHKLQGEGADIIIALTHIGLDESSGTTSEDIAKAVDGINLIIDGHSHTTLENGLQVNDTLIVQTGEYYKNVGFVEIIVNDEGVVSSFATLRPTDLEVEVDNALEFTPNESVQKFIDKVNEDSEVITNQVVGSIDFNLDGERQNVRTQETNLSSTIASSILQGTNADIAFMNGGGIRASIESGDITMGELITVLPFGNALITKDMLGSDIIAAIEHGVNSLPETAGHFPHLAGVNVVIDPSKPVGSRFVSITMENGDAFDPNKTYTVGLNEFMGAGGDGYTMFADYPVKMYFNTDADMFIDYINNNGKIYKEPAGRLVLGESVVNEVIDLVPIEDNAVAVVAPVEETELVGGVVGTYTVKPGDCLYTIGLELNIPWNNIADTNNITAPYLIYPNQVLNIR